MILFGRGCWCWTTTANSDPYGDTNETSSDCWCECDAVDTRDFQPVIEVMEAERIHYGKIYSKRFPIKKSKFLENKIYDKNLRWKSLTQNRMQRGI